MFRESENSTTTEFARNPNEKTNFINFKPTVKGIYDVYARNQLIVTYDLTGLTFGKGFFIIIAILAIVGIVYYGMRNGWFTNLKGSAKKEPQRRQVSPFELEIPEKKNE